MNTEALTNLNFSYWVLQTIAMMLTALFIPGLTVSGPIGAFLAVIALAFVNSTVWNAALFFQLPNTLSMQAGLLLLINGVIFWVIVKVLPGIAVRGVLPALAAPIVFTITSLLISNYATEINWGQLGSQIIVFIGNAKEYFLGSSQESNAFLFPVIAMTALLPTNSV